MQRLHHTAYWHAHQTRKRSKTGLAGSLHFLYQTLGRWPARLTCQPSVRRAPPSRWGWLVFATLRVLARFGGHTDAP